MTDKCKKCKYCKKDYDAWTYKEYKYCSLNVKNEDVDKCEHYKDKYTVKDYIEETFLGWILVIIIVILSLIDQLHKL